MTLTPSAMNFLKRLARGNKPFACKTFRAASERKREKPCYRFNYEEIAINATLVRNLENKKLIVASPLTIELTDAGRELVGYVHIPLKGAK